MVAWHGEGGLGVMKGLYGELRKRGIYTFGRYNVTMVAPPLTASSAEVDEAIKALDESLTAWEATL
jgi:taurine--2-oxoglutarate transaminase